MKNLQVALVQSVLVTSLLHCCVFAKTYYVIPTYTNTSECPPAPDSNSSNVHITPPPCLTLTEYARKQTYFFAFDSTFLFLPGNHTLNATFSLQNVFLNTFQVWGHISMAPLLSSTSEEGVSSANTNEEVRVVCNHKSRINLTVVSNVEISGITFLGCRGNYFNFVHSLTIKDVTFDGQIVAGSREPGLILHRITIARITRTLFTGHSDQHVVARQGGAVLVVLCKNLTISNSLFESNKAVDGGGLYTFNSNASIQHCTFRYNIATHGGGALCALAGSIVEIDSTTFHHNTASVVGGAICSTWSSNITIRNNSVFDFNTALNPVHPDVETVGGMLYSNGSYIYIYSSSFNGNMASKGGALYLQTSLVSLFASTFTNNSVLTSGNTLGHIGGAIYTGEYANVNIDGCVFTNNVAHYGGAVGIVINTTVSVSNSDFVSNSAIRGGGAISADVDGLEFAYNSLTVVGSTFRDNFAEIGGALYCYRLIMSMADCTFLHNTASLSGAVMHADILNLLTQNQTIITGNAARDGVIYLLRSIANFSEYTNFTNNRGSFLVFSSGVRFNVETNFVNNSQYRGDNLEQHRFEEGGSLTIYRGAVVVYGLCRFMYNQGTKGGAVLAVESEIDFNGDVVIAQNTAEKSGGGIYALLSEIQFRNHDAVIDSNTADGPGGGIHAAATVLRLQGGLDGGSLKFTENRGSYGGGVALELNSRMTIIKLKAECIENYRVWCNHDREIWMRMEFQHNTARYGGAVYVEDDSSGICSAGTLGESQGSTYECFLQILEVHEVNLDNLVGTINTVNVYFTNNSASVEGMAIYGGLLDRCVVSPFAELFSKYNDLTSMRAISLLSYITSFTEPTVGGNNNNLSMISSDPVNICFCKDNQPHCHDYQPPTVHVTKGGNIEVALVAVDQTDNPIPATIHGSLSSQHGGLKVGQESQNVNGMCTNLTYTVFSPEDFESLLLYAEGPCKDIGISQQSIQLSFLACSCPIGFQMVQSNISCECECDASLSAYIQNCSVDTQLLLRQGDFWVSYINDSNHSGFVVYPYCPFDYCQSEALLNFNVPNGEDVQCAYNRSGQLCGGCKDGLSLSLGSSRCVACSNSWLVLLVPFFLAGIALVIFLLLCNLSVAVGTINGLIFYANIVVANRATFIPIETPNVLMVFLAWFNLDLGIETCFYDGMDAYAKTWLQLAFPLYIICLVALIIKGSEHSQRLAMVLSGLNPVATLATLILLSYTKLLRTIIATLSFANLQFPDGTQETVWLFDANLDYLEGKHIPLFIMAVLILVVSIAFTLLLFLWQWLVNAPDWRVLSWIRNAKFNSFMDAYLAPYNGHHRYWSGLQLSIRALLYLVSSLNVVGDPRVNLLSVICVTAVLLGLKQHSKIYKGWLLDALETSFLLNLLFLSAGTWYTRDSGNNQVAISVTSITMALLSFLMILMYHFCKFILKKTKFWQKVVNKTKELDSEIPNSHDRSLSNPTLSGMEMSNLRQPLDLMESPPPMTRRRRSSQTELQLNLRRVNLFRKQILQSYRERSNERKNSNTVTSSSINEKKQRFSFSESEVYENGDAVKANVYEPKPEVTYTVIEGIP